ncbi:hypothetical protein BS47DRAFT_1349317 [Hydnum rufescens UP504]|uniref:Uncharacterized protein n=1 Tax=Hydnum rufescens UP504 TaxID=1448309 RepID=A0A9P6AP57_9AGAM|nr:hypothetical protein BS47DRAFT_1349317 [Hydnum rufescens UP504]
MVNDLGSLHQFPARCSLLCDIPEYPDGSSNTKMGIQYRTMPASVFNGHVPTGYDGVNDETSVSRPPERRLRSRVFRR